jgi:tetratricopeptide (TPR) repeat protein
MSEPEVAPEPTKDEAPAPAPAPRPAGERKGKPPVILFVALGVMGLVMVALWVSQRNQVERPSGSIGAVVGELEKAGRAAAAKRVNEACVNGATCPCRQAAALAALNADLHREAAAALATEDACAKEPKTLGMLAEATARSGKSDEATTQANAVLQKTANEPFAAYALAFAQWAKGDVTSATQNATLAATNGRGAAARLLLGLIAFRENDLTRAKQEFQQMLSEDVNDVDALYNLALIAQRQDRYREAREGYLKVLGVAPTHLDARYNLAVLTQSVGATNEAQHHAKKLEQAAGPNDERVVKLKQLLQRPAQAPGAITLPAPSAQPAPSR